MKRGKLGETAIKLRDTYEQYKTLKEAAEALGISTARASTLCKKLGITKWNRKPRGPETAAKPKLHECKQCQKLTSNKIFCSQECMGVFVGKHYGFGANKEQHLGQ